MRFTFSKIALLLATLTISANLLAQNDEGPTVPKDPEESVIQKAIEEAQAELDTKEKQFAEILKSIQDDSVSLQTELSGLRDKERILIAELKKLDDESFKIETEDFEITRKVNSTQDRADALKREIYSQATAYKSRFEKTLLSVENPELLQTIDDLLNQEDYDADQDLQSLMDVYLQTLTMAGQASKIRVPIRLPGGQGTIKEISTLRFGLVGGFYSNPEAGDAGFVSTDTEGDGGFYATSDGLSALQKSQIAEVVKNPSEGGLLPLDVTGGAGLATLQSRYTVSQWLELGGVFMWPLIIIAAVGLLMSIERGIVLALKAKGIRKATNQVVDHVQHGRFDAAEGVCKKVGGAIGAVLHSALVHRGQKRAVLEDAVQESLLHESPKFHTRLGFIALCAAVAPLMGLLGTVTGMISTFKMVTLFGTSDPRFMAGGISEALITTQGGLFVAIPCLLLRGVLGSLAASAVGKLETGAISVVLAVLKKSDPDIGTSSNEPTGDLPLIEEEWGESEEVISTPEFGVVEAKDSDQVSNKSIGALEEVEIEANIEETIEEPNEEDFDLISDLDLEDLETEQPDGASFESGANEKL